MQNIEFSKVVIALCQGAIQQGNDPRLWQLLCKYQTKVADYFAVMGLVLIMARDEGYGYLKQSPEDTGLPVLIKRYPLTYHTSLALVLLRKQMQIFDTKGSDSRMVITKQQLAQDMRIYQKNKANEARQMRETETSIKKLMEMGLLREIKNSPDTYEVSRLLRSYVDGNILHEIEQTLEKYRTCSGGQEVAEN